MIDGKKEKMTASNCTTLRVRYQETDRMESVYHAQYLVYFEIGRTEFMREHGICYRDMEEEGFGMVVVEAKANFHASAKYDDVITVRTLLPAHNRVSLKFEYTIHLGEGDQGAVLCSGYTILAFLGEDGRPQRIPERYLELIAKASDGNKLNRRQ